MTIEIEVNHLLATVELLKYYEAQCRKDISERLGRIENLSKQISDLSAEDCYLSSHALAKQLEQCAYDVQVITEQLNMSVNERNNWQELIWSEECGEY